MGDLTVTAGATPHTLLRAYRTAKVVLSHRVRQVDVPASPHFDEESTEYFRRELERTSNYLEFGSGGSTLLAHRMVKTVVSVESDGHFLAEVRRRLDGNPGAAATLIHANIGLTEEWGKPVFTRLTPKRVQRWQRYPQAPWAHYRRMGLEPDLILVDGRFRVACVLESLLHLSTPHSCRILCDDYAGRPHYHVVERFATVTLVGRMAVLRAKQPLDRAECHRLAEQYRTDPR
jgi:hypothetical protein